MCGLKLLSHPLISTVQHFDGMRSLLFRIHDYGFGSMFHHWYVLSADFFLTGRTSNIQWVYPHDFLLFNCNVFVFSFVEQYNSFILFIWPDPPPIWWFISVPAKQPRSMCVKPTGAIHNKTHTYKPEHNSCGLCNVGYPSLYWNMVMISLVSNAYTPICFFYF